MIEQGTAAIVLAAGSGSRMNSRIPKQYMELEGRPLISYTLEAFEKSSIERIVLVVSPDEESYCKEKIVRQYCFDKVCAIVAGGAERYDSVLCGLRALEGCTRVLIHDGARPFVTPEVIQTALDGIIRYRACVIGMPVKDTIKISDEQGFVDYTPSRDRVWMVQTPQAFYYDDIRQAYEEIMHRDHKNVTDDAMVAEQVLGLKIKLLKGSYYNMKITTPEDLAIAQTFLRQQKNLHENEKSS